MKHVVQHVRSHLKGHINDHQHHYLFGLFGGFALFKLFLLLTGITVVQYTIFATAQEEEPIEDPNPIIEMIDDEGEMIDDEEIGGGDREIGGGDGEIGGGDEEIGGGDGEIGGGDEEIGGGDEEIGGGDEEIGDGEIEEMCESGAVTWIGPLSGSQVRDVFDISWNYSGDLCLMTGITLELWDHNEQFIYLAELDSGAVNYSFDSKSLYSFQQSGLYHIIGTNMSGNDYYLYTGQYTGNYKRFFTGYYLRLLLPDERVLSQSDFFTIDNQAPTLTGIILTGNGSATGFVGLSGEVTLSFTASEVLTGIVVTLGSGKVPTSSVVSDLLYTYTWMTNSLYTEGPLVARIAFADEAGNTGSLVFTSTIVFDITTANVTGFVFTGTTSGVQLDFTASEPVRVDFAYIKSGFSAVSGSVVEYLTSHQIYFDDMVLDQLYIFTLSIRDRAGNTRSVTGDIMKTSTGQLISHIYIVPLSTEEVIEEEAELFVSILKAEVEKFNACKSAIDFTSVELEIRRNNFMLQMPDFQKSQVKTLVNAFTLFVLDKVKSNYTMTKSNIDDITAKFDSFLVILKLLRDDDNACKQNLSNYHISQFARALEEYGIAID